MKKKIQNYKGLKVIIRKIKRKLRREGSKKMKLRSSKWAESYRENLVRRIIAARG